MKSRGVACVGRVVLGMLVAGILVGAAAAQAAGGAPLSIGEEIALARLGEIRAIADAVQRLNWPGFDASKVPAVIHQPGAWALAVGFEQAPPGFAAAEGVKDGDRQVYRAGAGGFAAPARSPAQVGGRWAVISSFEAPAAMAGGRHMGRRSAEEAMADFFGDAFLVHLFEQRRQATPFSTGAAAWPESAELMALTSMESRAIVTPLQFREITEKNIEEYRRRIRQAIAIRHARWKLIGDDLAAVERQIENTEGLARFTAALVHRQSLNGAFAPTEIGKTDPTYREHSNANMLRLMSTHYPLSFSADVPESSTSQIAYRGAAMGALLDRLNVDWRPDAVAKGDFSMVAALAAKQGVKPEDEPALLESAKTDYRFDALLRLAQDDLARLAKDRRGAVETLFPTGPGTWRIRLGSAPVTLYLDDPDTTVSLGEGRLAHPGGLALKTAGLDLTVAPGVQGGPALAMTQAGARRDSVKSLTLRPGDGGTVTLGGRSLKAGKPVPAITSDRPLEVRSGGIILRAVSGSLTWGPDGSADLEAAK